MNLDLIKKSLFALSAKGSSAIFTLAMTLIVARTFDIKNSGEIFFYYTVVLIVSTFFRLGADVSIVKLNSLLEDRGDDDILRYKRIFAHFNLSVFIALLSIIVITIYGWFFNFFIEEFICIVISSLFLCLVTILAYDLQSKKKFYICNVLNFGIFPLFISLICLVPLHKTPISIIFISTFLSLAFTVGIYYAINFPTINSSKFFSLTQSDILGYLAESIKFLPISSINILMTWTSQIFVAYYLTAEDVAGLSVAQRVSMLLGFIVISVNSISAPMYSKFSSSNDNKKLKLAYYNSIKLCCLFGFLPLICSYFFRIDILKMFGEDYVEFDTVFIVLLVAQSINLATGSVGQLLQMSGAEKSLIYNMLGVYVFSIILLFSLVPLYGVFGAALAYAITFSLQNISNAISVYNYLKSADVRNF